MATTHAVEAGRAVRMRHGLRHFVEMVVAMYVGMAVFGGLFSLLLIALGTSYADATETAPELIAMVLVFNMTVPVVAWMHHRGASRAEMLAMTATMFGVGLVALVLLWGGAIESTAVCGAECALMIVAMAVFAYVRERPPPRHAD